MNGNCTIAAVRLGLCIALAAIGAAPAGALETSWQHDPAAPSDWFEPTNWTEGVPGAEDNAYINNGGQAQIPANSAEAACVALGQESGDSGTVRLSGTGQLSAESETIGRSGTGTLTQTGGRNTVTGILVLGSQDTGNGTYELGAGELELTAGEVEGAGRIGYFGTGTFIQSAGTHTVSADLWLGCRSGSAGSYALSGGSHTVGGGLILGDLSGSEGTYALSGTGQLSAGSEVIGRAGTGAFTHSGGTNTVGGGLILGGWEAGCEGTYALGGGEVSAGTETMRANSTFTQTGGSNTTGYLSVYDGGRYQLSGGTLTVTGGAEVLGTLNFADGSASVTMAGVLNLGNATLTGAGSTSFTLNADSLLMVPAGFDPATEFGTFTNHGSVVHQGGSTLTVPAGKAFTLAGPIEGHIACQGTINARSGSHIDLTGGVDVSGSGVVDLGPGTLAVEDTLSGISDTGQLSAAEEYIGRTGTGTFTQTGGTNTVTGDVYLGYDPGSAGSYALSGGTHTLASVLIGYNSESQGTYELSGTGELSANYETIGGYGTGAFTQTGGANTVSRELHVGVRGTYELSGGELSAGTGGSYDGIWISPDGRFTQTGGVSTTTKLRASGRYELGGGQLLAGSVGASQFIQTGGTNTISDSLAVGGTYELGGGELSAGTEAVSEFIQTGGINTIRDVLTVSGIYELSDGELSASAEIVGSSGTGTFTQTGGSNTVGYLYVNAESQYLFTGGTLEITDKGGLQLEGTLDFGGSAVTLNAGESTFLNMSSAHILGASQASLQVGPNSLTVFPAAFDPDTQLASFTTAGMVHVVGNQLVIPAGQSFTFAGVIEDHVACQGTITARSGDSIELRSGVNVSGSGSVDLGTGTLTVEDTLSGISGTAQLSAAEEYIGRTGTGTLTQTGGTHTVSDYLFVASSSGSQGTYELSGAAELSAERESIGLYGTGTLTQTGGKNTINASLELARGHDSQGTYELSGTGQLSAESEIIGRDGAGTFTHSGGTNTVSGNLYLAYDSSGSQGIYELSGTGQLSAKNEHIGGAEDPMGGTGAFIHTGGTNTVSEYLYVGYTRGPGGTYELSGTGQLSAEEELISGKGTFTQAGGVNTTSRLKASGRYELGGGQLSAAAEELSDFTQTGGINAITDVLDVSGTYELGGGELSATTEYVGRAGTGTFIQTGGSNTAGYLSLNSASRYEVSGGSLMVTDGAEVLGTLDFADGSASVTMAGVLNLGNATLTGADSTSFTLNPDSLLMVPAGFDPATEFGTFTNRGSVVYQLGLTLTVPAGHGFTGTLSIEDHVVCEGMIDGTRGNGINFSAGLHVSGSGTVDLGVGTLTVENTLSGISDTGQLSAEKEYIGRTGAGTFTQTGGTNTVSGDFYMGYDSGSQGTYELSGGELSATEEKIARSGTATFTQTGGTHTVSDLYLGGDYFHYVMYVHGHYYYFDDYYRGEGTYELSGSGQLSADSETIGYHGTGTFIQSGGTNTVSGDLDIGQYGTGTYVLSGTGELSAATERVWGSFTQTGGTNTISDDFLWVGGTYELSGTGQLSAAAERVWGSFTQTGGSNTVQRYLSIYANGQYLFTGGTLHIMDNGALDLKGTLDFGGGPASIDAAENTFIDLSEGNLLGGSQASLRVGANSLTVLPAGFDPDTQLASFSTAGLVHTAGTELVILPRESLTVWGVIDGHVRCEGTINAPAGRGLDLRGGVTVSDGGNVDLGESPRPPWDKPPWQWFTGTVIVNDEVSGISGGQLSAGAEYVGHGGGTGRFVQSGGSNVARGTLSLGHKVGSTGTYELSSGSLSAETINIADGGTGRFIQTGGTNLIGDTLSLGRDPESTGTYELGGGSLSAGTVSIADGGTGQLNWTGGTLDAGAVNVNSGGTMTVGLEGRYDGALTIDGGTLNADANLTADEVTVVAGALNLNGGATLTVKSMEVKGDGKVNTSPGQLIVRKSLVLGPYSYITDTGTFTAEGPDLKAGVGITVREPHSTLTISRAPRMVGLNFRRASNGAVMMDPIDSAGVIPQTSWNNGPAANFGTEADIAGPVPGVLVDQFGEQTPITMSFGAQTSWGTNYGTATGATGDEKMLTGYSDVIYDHAPGTYSFADIPFSLYDAYVYVGSDGHTRHGAASIDGGVTEVFFQTFGNANPFSATGYVEATSTTPTDDRANYVKFTGLTSGTVNIQMDRKGQNCGVHGIQLVETGGPMNLPNTNVEVTTDVTLNLDAESAILGGLALAGDPDPTVTLAGAPDVSFGRVSGTGTIEGAFSVDVLSPGASAGMLNVLGDLTLNDGAIYVWDFDGTDSDLVNISGKLETTAWTLKIRTAQPCSAGEHLVFTCPSGVFPTAPSFDVTEALRWDENLLAMVDDGAGNVFLAVVPEPGTLLLLATGTLVLLACAWRCLRRAK